MSSERVIPRCTEADRRSNRAECCNRAIDTFRFGFRYCPLSLIGSLERARLIRFQLNEAFIEYLHKTYSNLVSHNSIKDFSLTEFITKLNSLETDKNLNTSPFTKPSILTWSSSHQCIIFVLRAVFVCRTKRNIMLKTIASNYCVKTSRGVHVLSNKNTLGLFQWRQLTIAFPKLIQSEEDVYQSIAYK